MLNNVQTSDGVRDHTLLHSYTHSFVVPHMCEFAFLLLAVPCYSLHYHTYIFHNDSLINVNLRAILMLMAPPPFIHTVHHDAAMDSTGLTKQTNGCGDCSMCVTTHSYMTHASICCSALVDCHFFCRQWFISFASSCLRHLIVHWFNMVANCTCECVYWCVLPYKKNSFGRERALHISWTRSKASLAWIVISDIGLSYIGMNTGAKSRQPRWTNYWSAANLVALPRPTALASAAKDTSPNRWCA